MQQQRQWGQQQQQLQQQSHTCSLHHGYERQAVHVLPCSSCSSCTSSSGFNNIEAVVMLC
jgi:hypothetical protein